MDKCTFMYQMIAPPELIDNTTKLKPAWEIRLKEQPPTGAAFTI